MSLFNQTYYLDIDSNYRDESLYPNSTDFTIPFRTNTSTGFYAIGEPLNPQSFFEQVSIDPNFNNANITITNGTISNIKILEDKAFVSAVLNAGNVIFKYNNTGILSLTGINSNSAFLGRFDFSEFSIVPYIFNWCVYSDTNTGSTETTRTIFTFDLLDNIYMYFDTSAINTNVYYLLNNSTPIEYYNLYNKSKYLYNNKCLFLIYLTIDGNKGFYDNHDWGYHKISSEEFNLDSALEQGRFGGVIDNGNNLILDYNINNNSKLYYRDFIVSRNNILYLNVATPIRLYGFNDYSYSGINYIITNLDLGQPNTIPNSSYDPRLSISIDLETGTVLQNYISIYIYPFISSLTRCLFINYTGNTGSGLYSFIGYSDATVFGTSNMSFPLNVMKFSNDLTTGYLFSQSSGPAGNNIWPYPVLIENNCYIWCLNSDIVSTLSMYKYNFIDNSMLLLQTGSITGTYSKSNLIYHKAYTLYNNNDNIYYIFNPIIGITMIYKYTISTNIIEFCSTLNIDFYLGLLQTRLNKTFYIYGDKGVLYILDLTDSYNPIINSYLEVLNGSFIEEYNIIDNSGNYKYLLLTSNTTCNILDITDLNNVYILQNIFKTYSNSLFLPNIFFNKLYIYTYDGFFSIQYLLKSDILNSIDITNTHYNINSQQIFNTDYQYTNMSKFNINTTNYICFTNSTYLDIYVTNSIINTYKINSFNISLPSNITLTKSYFFNNLIYVLIVTVSNNYYLYSINEEITNINLLFNSTTNNIVDASLYYSPYNNNLLLCTITNLTITLYTITNSSLVQQFTNTLSSPYTYTFSLMFNNFYQNQDILLLYTNNSADYFVADLYVYNITDLNNINIITTETIFSGVKNVSYKLANSNIYLYSTAIVDNISKKDLRPFIFDNSFNVLLFRSYDVFDVMSNFYALDTIQQTNKILYFGSLNTSNTGINNVGIGQQSVLNISSNSFNRNSLSFNSICLGISLFSNLTSTYFVALLNNQTLYSYDITNLNFAINNQNLTISSTTSIGYPNYSAGVINKILQDGTSDYVNIIGGNMYDTQISKDISLSNIDITDDYKNIFFCGNFTKSVNFYQITSTGSIVTKNYIFYNNVTADNSFIGKMSPNGNFNFAIPLLGPISNILERMQINNSLSHVSFVGYSNSINFFVYTPQMSSLTGYIQPTTIQKVFNIISNINGIFLTFDYDGNLINDLQVFTTNQSRDIRLYDLTIDENQTCLVGISNANILNIQSSLEFVSQTLYSSIDSSNSSNLFMIVLDNTGYFKYTNLIDVSGNVNITVQDIKQDSSLDRIFFSPSFFSSAGVITLTIYNRDGTLGRRVTYNTQFTSPVIQYTYDPLYTDTNGVQYSQIVYVNPPSYPFEDQNFNNYILFLVGNVDNVDVNGNYYVRYNEYDGEKYKLILNTIIEPTLIIKQFSTINNITGSNNYFNMQLSSSYLEGYIIYDLTTVPNVQNQIVAISEIAAIDPTSFYYFMLPFESSTGTINKLVPITNIELNQAGNYVFTVEDINDLRVSLPSGAFYGPYIPIVLPNDKLYSVIPFFGSSIFTPIYYNITLDSITLPNRPIKSLPIPGVRSWNDIPFFYVSIYPVDDEGNYDPETVNVVYTNTKLLILPTPIFKIQSFETSDTSNFVTFNSITTPIIKFDKNYTNLRVTVYDPDGEVILFDISATKESDSDFLFGLLPITLTNVYLRITLTKR